MSSTIESLSPESLLHESLSAAADLPWRLAAALAEGGICGRESPRFAPELSYGRHAGPPPYDARSAAVIVLIFRRGGRWHIPLTVRHAALEQHAGQISLPGGTVDAGETTADAARRELAEELGVSDSVELLAALPESYVYVSNFRVTPWLAVTEQTPVWRPQADEVDRIIELPLDALVDQSCRGMVSIERGPLAFRAPCFQIGTDCVWGATSIILGQLAGLIGRMAQG